MIPTTPASARVSRLALAAFTKELPMNNPLVLLPHVVWFVLTVSAIVLIIVTTFATVLVMRPTTPATAAANIDPATFTAANLRSKLTGTFTTPPGASLDPSFTFNYPLYELGPSTTTIWTQGTAGRSNGVTDSGKGTTRISKTSKKKRLSSVLISFAEEPLELLFGKKSVNVLLRESILAAAPKPGQHTFVAGILGFEQFELQAQFPERAVEILKCALVLG
jgi:hypothetical protein